MRALRQSGTVEGAATAKLLKRGKVKLRLRKFGAGDKRGGYNFMGENTVYVNSRLNAQRAAGLTGHETRHVLQKLTPSTYRLKHEFEAIQWQLRIDPRFAPWNDADIWAFLKKSPLYKDVRR